jgi:hypothetical protein
MITPRIFESLQVVTVSEATGDGNYTTITKKVYTDTQIDLSKVIAFNHYINPETGNIDSAYTEVYVEGLIGVKILKINFILFKELIDAL